MLYYLILLRYIVPLPTILAQKYIQIYVHLKTKSLEYCTATGVEDTSEGSRDDSVAVQNEDDHGDIQRVEAL